MKSYRITLLAIIGMLFMHLLSSHTTATDSERIGAAHPSTARIQIALLLDTSNSMDGLIAQAKSQLWRMVNELSAAKKGGHPPTVELALYHYGNSGLSGETYFIQKLTPLTTDLDLVSEKLFSLSTNGGNEYCGAVIQKSLDELEWTNDPKDLRLIMIAGNEAFSQGPIPYTNSCQLANKKGIQINTIFCGDYMTGKSTFWEDGAKLAEGKYMNIDQDRTITIIRTPYDDQIIQLNLRLNKTYLGYGDSGLRKHKRQMEQDANAYSSSPSTAVDRSMTKANGSYKNADWDLVDAIEEEAITLDEVKVEQLPDVMQGMNAAERSAYVISMKKERAAIQKEMNQLSKKAKDYRAKNKSTDNANTLDEVLIETVKEQARKKNFQLD